MAKVLRLILPAFAIVALVSAACYFGASARLADRPAIDHARVTEKLISIQLIPRGDDSCLLRVRNESPIAVAYYGHAEESPIYALEILKAGVWTDVTGWCGVGIERRTLKPKSSFTVAIPGFGIRADGAERIRATIGFQSVPRSDWEREKFLRNVRSNELQFPAKG